MPKYSMKAEKDAIEQTPVIPYDLIIVDADTMVFRASKFIQEDYITVTHKKSGKSKEYANKTEFYGHWKNKDKGHLAEINKKREARGKKPFLVEDFEIEENVRLLDEIDDHVKEALTIFDMSVGNIRKTNLAEDYLLLIGGKDNYRYDYAQSLPYKGQRVDKPILFESVREAIIDKYKRKIRIVDGKEVDDEMAVYGYDNVQNYKENNEWKYVLAFIDKDLKMIEGPNFNYDHITDGKVEVFNTNELEAMRYYAKQLLLGDKTTDNIQGLPNLTEDLRLKYGIRKGKSLGETTANNYLSSADSVKELFTRVVRAYISYYGLDKFEFVSHRGETKTVSWKDMLQEVAMLIYMNPYENPLEYKVLKHFKEYSVNIKEIEDEYKG